MPSSSHRIPSFQSVLHRLRCYAFDFFRAHSASCHGASFFENSSRVSDALRVAAVWFTRQCVSCPVSLQTLSPSNAVYFQQQEQPISIIICLVNLFESAPPSICQFPAESSLHIRLFFSLSGPPRRPLLHTACPWVSDTDKTLACFHVSEAHIPNFVAGLAGRFVLTYSWASFHFCNLCD